MFDGRFDQHFAEVFASRPVDGADPTEMPPIWPLLVATVVGVLVFIAGVAFSAAPA